MASFVVCWWPLQTVWTQSRTDQTSVLIWIQTIWHTDAVSERIFSKKLILKKVSRRQKHEKLPSMQRVKIWLIIEPVHEISNNVVWATSKASDQPAHTRSLIRAFASRLSILDCKATDWIQFGVSKLKRRLQRLVWVYNCQNGTLLEITCHGSYILHYRWVSRWSRYGSWYGSRHGSRWVWYEWWRVWRLWWTGGQRIWSGILT